MHERKEMMSKLVDIEQLLRTVGAESKDKLEEVLDNSSPSLIEYSIRNLIKFNDETYLNLANAESKLTIGNIEIIFDYDENCHVIDNYSIEREYGQIFL